MPSKSSAVDIARAINVVMGEELPRALEPVRRQIGDLRSGVDRAVWRLDQRERERERLDLRDTVTKAVTCMVRAFTPPERFPTLMVPGEPATVAAETALDLARDTYAGQPDVAFALRDLPKLVRKAASVPASIATDSWAGIFSSGGTAASCRQSRQPRSTPNSLRAA